MQTNNIKQEVLAELGRLQQTVETALDAPVRKGGLGEREMEAEITRLEPECAIMRSLLFSAVGLKLDAPHREKDIVAYHHALTEQHSYLTCSILGAAQTRPKQEEQMPRRAEPSRVAASKPRTSGGLADANASVCRIPGATPPAEGVNYTQLCAEYIAEHGGGVRLEAENETAAKAGIFTLLAGRSPVRGAAGAESLPPNRSTMAILPGPEQAESLTARCKTYLEKKAAIGATEAAAVASMGPTADIITQEQAAKMSWTQLCEAVRAGKKIQIGNKQL